MRGKIVALALAMLPAFATLAAQQPDTSARGTPTDVAERAAARYNSSAVVLRSISPLVIEDGREVKGDVAVLGGPLTIAGHVTGSVVAINSDVVLRPTARLDGDLLVVGGDLEGRERAYVGGEITVYREAMRYRQEGEQIVALGDDEQAGTADRWWRRWERRRADHSWSKIQVASAGAYNRVEGLPINLGPQIFRKTTWGSVRLDAYAILRTGSSFASADNDVGHNVRGELRIGRLDGFALGGTLFNVVDGVESWQLSDLEVGLASFLAHRDYRDYFQRHGANLAASLFARRSVSLTGSFSDERWLPRTTNDPFTLFRNDADWRPNPLADMGRMHLATGTLTADTRSDPENPWSGWYAVAEWERGVGLLARYSPAGAGLPTFTAPVHTDYTRGFVDVRRYNRISPDAQLNFRAVLGGWLNGSALPLERRFSVDGPGALPGFGFRSDGPGEDVGSCNVGAAYPGQPALCDRIALVQMEYRGDLHLDFSRDWDFSDDRAMPGERDASHARTHHFRHDGTWVLFGDAGRGWLVGSPSGTMTYSRGVLPPLSTFRSDIGGGLDFGVLGFYMAKAVSSTGEPLRFFVRLRHRF